MWPGLMRGPVEGQEIIGKRPCASGIRRPGDIIGDQTQRVIDTPVRGAAVRP